jgi:predicted O-methyltransferase YrrM
MPKVYRLSRVGSRLLYKIRHHRGHGIHSPFVFDLITKVIEEKTPFYVYEDINRYLESFPELQHQNNKVHRLLFRFINWFSAKTILELGAGTGVSTLYLTVASSDIHCRSVEISSEKYEQAGKLYEDWERNIQQYNEPYPELGEKFDCIFVNLRNYKADFSLLADYLLSLVREDSFIIMDGIRTNEEYQMLWRKLIARDEVFVSLDLYHLGILFFDKKYYKRNYKLSF